MDVTIARIAAEHIDGFHSAFDFVAREGVGPKEAVGRADAALPDLAGTVSGREDTLGGMRRAGRGMRGAVTISGRSMVGCGRGAWASPIPGIVPRRAIVARTSNKSRLIESFPDIGLSRCR